MLRLSFPRWLLLPLCSQIFTLPVIFVFNHPRIIRRRSLRVRHKHRLLQSRLQLHDSLCRFCWMVGDRHAGRYCQNPRKHSRARREFERYDDQHRIQVGRKWRGIDRNVGGWRIQLGGRWAILSREPNGGAIESTQR